MSKQKSLIPAGEAKKLIEEIVEKTGWSNAKLAQETHLSDSALYGMLGDATSSVHKASIKKLQDTHRRVLGGEQAKQAEQPHERPTISVDLTAGIPMFFGFVCKRAAKQLEELGDKAEMRDVISMLDDLKAVANSAPGVNETITDK